jgi:hypothetical protein
MSLKKREFDEYKLKINQDLDLGKLKVSEMKIDMRENHLRVINIILYNILY